MLTLAQAEFAMAQLEGGLGRINDRCDIGKRFGALLPVLVLARCQGFAGDLGRAIETLDGMLPRIAAGDEHASDNFERAATNIGKATDDVLEMLDEDPLAEFFGETKRDIGIVAVVFGLVVVAGLAVVVFGRRRNV